MADTTGIHRSCQAEPQNQDGFFRFWTNEQCGGSVSAKKKEEITMPSNLDLERHRGGVVQLLLRLQDPDDRPPL